MLRVAQIRKELHTGDVLEVRQARWLGALPIRKRTDSVYSHVALILDLEDGLFIAEATWPQGVRLVPLDKWLKGMRGEVDLFAVDPDQVNTWKMRIFAMNRLGDPYSLWQLVASWGHVVRLIRRFSKKPKDVNRQAWICSEFVSAAFLAGGYRHDEKFLPAETDPGMVARFTCLRRRGQLML